MDPLTAALKTAEAGFIFGAELCKLLASDNGKLIIQNNIKNEERFNAVVQRIGQLFDNGIKAMQKTLEDGK